MSTSILPFFTCAVCQTLSVKVTWMVKKVHMDKVRVGSFPTYTPTLCGPRVDAEETFNKMCDIHWNMECLLLTPLTQSVYLGAYMNVLGVALACLLVALIGLGRIYLGMHSLVDVLGGLLLGLGILAFWLAFYECLDSFVVSGQNVASFWAALCFLWLFAYPTPELPTPSFEYHIAFNGVALGIVY
ncbi:hypothetical protein K1719_041683 [Acacia pycnantha]|nr:hypothetical protein K1719_041683 [Acacia pycnantha]